MKKIIKDRYINPKKLRSYDFTSYETVEHGEKHYELKKLADSEYTPGEVGLVVNSFDEEVELHRAVVVQDAHFTTQKYQPLSFDAEPKELIKTSEPESVPEEVQEEEPEQPAISEEELETIRLEAYQKGMQDGMSRGIADGEQKARKQYEADRSDYLAKLEQSYNSVIAQVGVYQKAVDELDAALPDMIESMVCDIVGKERKINKNIIVSITKNSLGFLKEMEKVVFMVNPDDVETMTDLFPDYETQADRTVMKGDLRVQTNVGELNFSIDRMLKEFVERINEEFRAPETD